MEVCPSRSSPNNTDQDMATAKVGIMNGKAANTPMVRRIGISVMVTSQARKPPKTTQDAATMTPIVNVLVSGTHNMLRAIRPVNTSRTASSPSDPANAAAMPAMGTSTKRPSNTKAPPVSPRAGVSRRPAVCCIRQPPACAGRAIKDYPVGAMAYCKAYCKDRTRSATSCRAAPMASGAIRQALKSSSGIASGWGGISVRVR